MPAEDVQVYGSSGPVVLLLPGGAESCVGFFPGLVEGLVEDPGCRVIVHDRPGTGTSNRPGTLAGASTYLNSLIQDLACGPVIVVGQSLGGAVALLLAADHPEVVAGLILLDPTPINDAPACARLERVMKVLGRLASFPLAGAALQAALRGEMRRSMRHADLRTDCRAAAEKIGEVDVAKLAAAVRGITRLSADFREDRLPRVPAVLVTADRSPTGPIAHAHARLAAALAAPTVTWAGATHNVQLDHPDETLGAVRELITRVAVTR
jgi:pimeloyl-ACP methyl ester carboxylesterase